MPKIDAFLQDLTIYEASQRDLSKIVTILPKGRKNDASQKEVLKIDAFLQDLTIFEASQRDLSKIIAIPPERRKNDASK